MMERTEALERISKWASLTREAVESLDRQLCRLWEKAVLKSRGGLLYAVSLACRTVRDESPVLADWLVLNAALKGLKGTVHLKCRSYGSNCEILIDPAPRTKTKWAQLRRELENKGKLRGFLMADRSRRLYVTEHKTWGLIDIEKFYSSLIDLSTVRRNVEAIADDLRESIRDFRDRETVFKAVIVSELGLVDLGSYWPDAESFLWLYLTARQGLMPPCFMQIKKSVSVAI